MQEFRRLVKGPIGKILLGAIIIAFTASGFYGYFVGGGSENIVAEVDGNPIYRQQLSQQVQRYRARVRQQQPNLDPAMLETFITPSRVLQGLVNNELILAYARDADMTISERQALEIMRQFPEFQGEDGGFSRERFEQMMATSGVSAQQYLDGLRKDLLLNQVRTAYQVSDFGLPHELATQRRLGEQTRDFRYLQLPVGELAQTFEVTEEDVKAFYTSHRDDFMRPEQFKLAYIELNPANYRDRVEITDEEVRREYEARKQMMDAVAEQQRQRREAAHILLQTGDQRSEEDALARARALRQRIQQGASFAEVAREASEDAATSAQGGKLGVIEEGTLPGPMEDALFDLEPGEVSRPVVTEAGVHLVKLIGLEEKKVPSLENLRDQIVADLRQARVQALMDEDVTALDSLAYEHSGLQTPAEKLGVEIQTTDWFTLQSASGIASLPPVRQALQSPQVKEDDRNSELLELGDGRYVVIHLADRAEPEPLALSEVENSIRTRIARNRARETLDQLAEQARKGLEAGSVTLTDLAGQWGVKVRQADDVQRGAGEPDARLVNEAFSMPRPGEGTSGPRMLRLPDGGLAAVTLTNVTDGDPGGLTEEQRSVALTELGNREGERSFRQLMSHLRQALEVDINENVLGKLEGEASSPEG